MIESLMIGLVAGARSLTPLAAVAWLARRNALPNEGPVAHLLALGPVATGTGLFAIGEMLGDKMRTAPDRTVLPGLAARAATGAIAGAALASRRDQTRAAALGAVTAIGSSCLTLALRRRLMERFGQRPTGLAEDALVLAGTLWVVERALRSRPGR